MKKKKLKTVLITSISIILKDLGKNCEIYIKYKKIKMWPVVAFPFAKIFNESMAMDLKEWPHYYYLASSHDRPCDKI